MSVHELNPVVLSPTLLYDYCIAPQCLAVCPATSEAVYQPTRCERSHCRLLQSQTKVLPERLHYYGALAPLLIFYAIFVAVLYPLAPLLHPYHLLESFKAMLPDGKTTC